MSWIIASLMFVSTVIIMVYLCLIIIIFAPPELNVLFGAPLLVMGLVTAFFADGRARVFYLNTQRSWPSAASLWRRIGEKTVHITYVVFGLGLATAGFIMLLVGVIGEVK